MSEHENPKPESEGPIAIGTFLSASTSQLFGRTILNENDLVALRPWLHRLTEIFIICSCIGIVLVLHGRLLVAPPLFAWAWLAATAGALFLIRLHPVIRREYFISMAICTVSILGWVALIVDPFSSVVAFSNLVFIGFLIFALTPLAGFAMFTLTMVGIYIIRVTQMVLDIDAGLSMAPLSWIEAGLIGVIFLLHFLSISFLVNVIWVQKERSHESHALLEEANAHLLASEQARSVFLSTLTHELRTPLTSIQGYADLMLAHPNKHPEGLAIVKRATGKLGSLFDEFLNLADPPSLASRMTLETLSLNRILQEEVAGLQRQAHLQGASLQLLMLAACTIQADPIRISQVVSNLLENAIQHTPSGKSITVSLTATDDWAVLRVEDTGAGISHSDLQHIFNPFFSKESLVKKRKGAGLGLTICHQIVTASRGTITVESNLGQNTTFTVKLPLVKQAPAHPTVPETPDARVLVMDDEPEILSLMRDTISRMGITVSTAADGPTALEMALRESYHVIILDINVPELSGIEVSRRLRQAGCQSKIFLFSAMPAKAANAAVLNAQADGFIPKPYQYDALVLQLRAAGLVLTS